MAEDPIDITKEIEEANARLPITLPDDRNVPLDMQMRVIALTIAQRHVGDTVVKEGELYQQLKLAGTNIKSVTIDDVINTALVFERYLWGQWSRGIAENAINAVSTEVADALEGVYQEGTKRAEGGGPTAPSADP